MTEIGINTLPLSHNRRMEKQTIERNVLTEEKTGENNVCISRREAEEYRAYKRKKLQADIATALAGSESSLLNGEDIQRVCDRAIRLRQVAVKVPLSRLAVASRYLSGSKVKLDCVIGGTGETLTKVKSLEAKLATKRKASEITLVIAPSLVDGCRYGEIRREIKKVRRAVGKTPLKVRVEQTASLTTLSRLARVACEAGAKFFSVPYFQECERLKNNFTRGCALEISGVNDTENFRRLFKAGVARIVSNNAFEIYADWLKKGYEELLAETKQETKQEIKEERTQTQTEKSETEKQTGEQTEKNVSSETDYRCRLEGTKLYFY